MKRISPFIRHKSTYCPKCGNEDSMIFYNINGNPMLHISTYTVADLMEKVRIPLSHMRCNNCGTICYIDYSLHNPRAANPQDILEDMFNG